MKTEFRLHDWKNRPLLPPSEPVPSAPVADHHGYVEGVRCFSEGDFTTARRRFSQALVAEPGNAMLLAALGHAWLHEGNARRAFEQYDRLGAAPADVAYNRALVMMGETRWPEAIAQLRSVYDTPPNFRKGQFYLGLLFASTADLQCDVAVRLGASHQQLGQLHEAREWYERALKASPHNVTAHQRLAELDIHGRNYLSSIAHLRAVLEHSRLEEDQIHAHNNLGVACYENGMLDEAITHLTWVLRHAPANPSAVHNLNYIYEAESLFLQEDSAPYSIRLVDVQEGALPIFGLTTGEDYLLEGDVVVGRSAAMLRTMRHARVAAASDAPVLITGEGGTGKELLAHMIARNSARRDAPFRVVNCASKSELLLESELFGHEKGAFTGARTHRPGALELASGGTLLIKEIDALSPLLQGKLARAIREKRYTPIGSTQEMPLNLRLISSTGADLAELVRERAFREELLYALNVVPIDVPPLRERTEDIPLLVEHFLQKYARRPAMIPPTLGPEDMGVLMEHAWPGNVRELESLIARAVVMGTQSNLYLEELAKLRRSRVGDRRPRLTNESGDHVTYPAEITLADLERRHIAAVLEIHKHNQRKAAQILGINPSTLWRKLKSYDSKEEE